MIDHLLKETSGKIDILGISETHLNSDIVQGEITVDGYTFIRKDRKTGPGGGVGCFIRNDLGWQRRTDLENDGVEAIWLEIFIKHARPLLVCNIYRPPITSKHLIPEFETIFEDMISTGVCEDKETILLGDMNADYLQQSKDKNIKRIISTNGLKQLIEKPTRVTKDSSTLIDIIATSHEQNILKSMTFANSIRDHDLVGMIMKKNNRKFKPRTIYTRNFAKYNEANYKADLRHLDWKNVTQESNVNKAWDIFKSLWKSVIDKHAPLIKKRVRGRESPWFTNEIKIKAHERDYYLRKARRTNKEIDWSTYRRLRNDVTRSIRQSKANYSRQIFRENINTPRKFWSQIKKCFPTKGTKEAGCKVFNVDGKRSSNVKEIANGFCKFFTNIGKNLQNVLPKLTDIAWTHHDHSNSKRKLNPQNCTFTFQRVSSKEIKDIMRKLNRKKAQGYDEIPTSFVKDGADILAGPLASLINRCLANSRFPSAEKCSKVIPVYKSEERSLLDNYRPISILPVKKIISFQKISLVFEPAHRLSML